MQTYKAFLMLVTAAITASAAPAPALQPQLDRRDTAGFHCKEPNYNDCVKYCEINNPGDGFCSTTCGITWCSG